MQLRREHIANPPGLGKPGPVSVAIAVQRGESVRITGLGVLAAVVAGCTCGLSSPQGGCKRAPVYRLTLTAAVAKQAIVRRDPPELGPYLEADIRHLANALSAPVEAWAPAVTALKHGRRPKPATRIATVQP